MPYITDNTLSHDAHPRPRRTYENIRRFSQNRRANVKCCVSKCVVLFESRPKQKTQDSGNKPGTVHCKMEGMQVDPLADWTEGESSLALRFGSGRCRYHCCRVREFMWICLYV